LDCPRCKLALVPETYEGVAVDLCKECWGVWLDTGELETILQLEQLHFSPEEKKLVLEGRSARAKAQNKPVGCPKCSVRMERLFLDPEVYLVIDRCPRHGVWLDTGEIKAIQAMAEASQKVNQLLVRKIQKQN